MVNILDFWFSNEDARNVKDGLQIFSQVWLKMLSTNGNAGFLNQLCLNKKTDKLT